MCNPGHNASPKKKNRDSNEQFVIINIHSVTPNNTIIAIASLPSYWKQLTIELRRGKRASDFPSILKRFVSG